MNYRIPLSVPSVGAAEEAALLSALQSGWVSSAGPHLTEFEQGISQATGRDYAVAVSSGTAALHLALLSAGVGEGDFVPCSTLTFAATANAICYTGATPVFIDATADGTIDIELLSQAVAQLHETGKPIGALLPVDLYGRMADYPALQHLADRYQVPLIVDAAESLGANRGTTLAGSAGAASCVSFNGNKIITTSGGGAVVSDDADLIAHIKYLAQQAKVPAPHYQHQEIGYNYRMSNLLAALGSVQLARLPEFIHARAAHRQRYTTAVELLPGLRVLNSDDQGDNCWLTAVMIDPVVAGFTPAQARAQLAEHGIETRAMFKPMHTQPVFADPHRYPRYLTGVADEFFATGLLLPSSPATSGAECDEVIDRLANCGRTQMGRAS